MASVEFSAVRDGPEEDPVTGSRRRVLHRIQAVRQQQGMSLRSVARHQGTEVSKLREQEIESTDLLLSELYRWQRALDVPVADLLVDSGGPLSRPVMERAQMLRLMKTATALLESSKSITGVHRMAQMLVDQLVEIMPELATVSPWHSVGQRRSLDEYGRVVERQLSEDALFRPRHND